METPEVRSEEEPKKGFSNKEKVIMSLFFVTGVAILFLNMKYMHYLGGWEDFSEQIQPPNVIEPNYRFDQSPTNIFTI